MVVSRIPSATREGDFLSIDDLKIILETLEARKVNFPEEPFEMALGTVLFNLGDRFAPVRCVAGEWQGFKHELPRGNGLPKCPNGHACTQGFGLKLGWIREVPFRVK